ncbi:MAG: hypothetical protein LBL69_03300 [Zoogloeaceae bacterium]|nr:hypothetical protein [Zoogloeaceae bacterium]
MVKPLGFTTAALTAALLCACIPQGAYRITPVDETGRQLAPQSHYTVRADDVYATRDKLCAQFPKATILIENAQTGKELELDSPYDCRR